MTPETDYPQQRTVAELLAAHGSGVSTGRRRRRRVAEEAEPAVTESVAAPVANDIELDEQEWSTAAEPDRSMLRDPVPDDPHIGVASTWDSLASTRYAEPATESEIELDPAARPAFRAPVNGIRVESPTEQIPLIGNGDR